MTTLPIPPTITKYLGVTPPVSTHPATSRELEMTDSLTKTLQELGLMEADEEAEQRELVLGRLNQLVKEFARQIGIQKQLPEDLLNIAGGKIFTFGSYRLGVHSRGADIDTLCVVPQHVDRSDFFTHFFSMLQSNHDVTELTKVPDAYVPVMKMKFSGISIDLLFARVAESSVPNDLDLLDNRILRNLDEKCVLSVNGSRTTDEILRLVPNVEVFHLALRTIKLWAKKRGLYSNAMGYLGGVACALLVARVCQLYPNGCAATIIGRFFRVYVQWNWPQPVMLKLVEECNLGLKVWNPRVYPTDRFHRMPVITPAYPSMCSTHNVTQSNLDLFISELRRGADIMQKIERGMENWTRLYEETDFFYRYKHFVQVIAICRSEEHFRIWSGFVESRIRILASKFEMEQDIQGAPPFPSGFEAVGLEDSDEAIRHLHFYNENSLESKSEDGAMSAMGTSVAEDSSSIPHSSSICNPPNEEMEKRENEGENENSNVNAKEKENSSCSTAANSSYSNSNSPSPSSSSPFSSNEDKNKKEKAKDIKVWTSAFYIAISAVPLEKGLGIIPPPGRRRLILDGPVFEFKNILDGWDKKTLDMTILVRDVKRDNLPEYLFQGKARPAKLKKASSASRQSLQQNVPVMASTVNSSLNSFTPLASLSLSMNTTGDDSSSNLPPASVTFSSPTSNSMACGNIFKSQEEEGGKRSKLNGGGIGILPTAIDSDGNGMTFSPSPSTANSTTIRRSSTTTTEYSMDMVSNEEYSSSTATIGNNV